MAKRKSGARGGFRGGGGRGNNGSGRGGADWVLPGPGSARGRGHNHSGSIGSIGDELDFTLQKYANVPSPVKPAVVPSPRGRGFSAYRGRGRGGPLNFRPSQLSATTTFPGRGRGGFDIPRRYVQGIGVPKDARRAPVKVGAKQTLSNLLHQERPLLRPIVFVPSTETRFLFQNEEELLQPIVEGLDDTVQSHIPTADRVTRVFSGGNLPPDIWDNAEDGTEDEDELEVVDFKDVGKLFVTAATTSKAAIPKRQTRLATVENTAIHEELISRIGNQETRPPQAEALAEIVEQTLSPPNDVSIGETSANGNQIFYVDTQPGNFLNRLDVPAIPQLSSGDDDDDIIVYNAPHPRNAPRISEPTEDVTTNLTANDHEQDISRFSAYKRPAALPALVSNTPLKASIPTEADEPLSSMAPVTATTPCIPEPPSFSSIPFTSAKPSSTHAAENTNETGSATAIPRLRIPPITTPRQAKLWNSKLSRISKGVGAPRAGRKTSFGALGAMREEGLLRKLDGERDDRYDERRRGDSDLDWGDTTDADVGVEEVVDTSVKNQEQRLDADMMRVLGMLEKGKGKAEETLKQATSNIGDDHEMEVDVDVDIATMRRFVEGLTGTEAGTYVTMDDIECEEMIRMEDEGDDVEQRGSSEDEGDDESGGAVDEQLEEEEVLRIEEAKFMHDGDPGNLHGSDDKGTEDLGEGADDNDDDDHDYEDNSFRFKLDRIRAKSVETKAGDFDDSDDSDDSDDLFENITWAEQDDAFMRHLDDILAEKESAKDRKHTQKLFSSMVDDYEHLDSAPARSSKDKYKDPPELSLQFEKDRQKKAEWKRTRELERLSRAADPLSKKKGGEKGRKAMLAAATADPTIIVLPNRVVDMTTLVQQIRRFVADMGATSMSLPPTEKQTRKNIHEVAAAFSLKSVSKGKGDSRYTTLTKTTKSGIRVNEGKIAWIIRRSGARGDSFVLEDKKGKGVMRAPRQKEGDVVGKAAPKLDESNVGFKLLAMMGWSEGDRIGASTNGLEVPLAAVIKTSKLGLGARK